MPHYLVIYETAPDYMARRGLFRDAHLAHAWAAEARGELILGGALADPPDRAIILFQGDGPEAAIAFAENDPYVREGIVSRWEVRPWTTVVGQMAATPVRPV